MSILSKPGTALSVSRENVLYFTPEPGRMVMLPQMGQFMSDDVIDYFHGRHDQAPTEIKSAPDTAGTPSGFRAAEPKAGIFQLRNAGVELDTRRDYFPGPAHVPFNE